MGWPDLVSYESRVKAKEVVDEPLTTKGEQDGLARLGKTEPIGSGQCGTV
jgi:hypothetical protein